MLIHVGVMLIHVGVMFTHVGVMLIHVGVILSSLTSGVLLHHQLGDLFIRTLKDLD